VQEHERTGTLPAKADLVSRLARVVAASDSHHVTQRGKARRIKLDRDADRKVYLDLLRDNLETARCRLGFCLMSNHSFISFLLGLHQTRSPNHVWLASAANIRVISFWTAS
jgi:REP element-mobilizing transposase RayT